MDYPFEIREVPAQPAIYIRTTCGHNDIGPTLARIYPEVGRYAAEHGGQMAGPPFCRYQACTESGWDMEGGMTLVKAIPGSERVEAGTLGGGRALFTVHVGPYDRLRQAYDAAEAWFEKNGVACAGAPWEVYVTDPGRVPNPEEWRTEIYWPVR